MGTSRSWVLLLVGVAALFASHADAQPVPRKKDPAFETGPMVVRFPHAATAWGAAVDTTQQVHVACAGGGGSGKGGLWYLRSNSAHSEWPVSAPVPTGDDEVTVAGIERGPRIALGGDGGILIAWQSKDRVAARRSEDGGKSWKLIAVRDANATGGIDMVAMASTQGPQGEQIALLWNDSRGHGKYTDDFSTALYMAVSTDGGKTFGKNIWLNEGQPGACPCCLPSAQYDSDGRLWVAYRSSDHDVKETTVLRVERGVCVGAGKGDRKKGVAAWTISHDQWHMVGCPMNGPSIAAQWEGMNIAVLWTKDQQAYYAMTTTRGAQWSDPKPLGKGPRHAAAGAAGDMWMLWGDERAMKLAPANDPPRVEDVTATASRGAALIVLFQQPALVVPETKKKP